MYVLQRKDYFILLTVIEIVLSQMLDLKIINLKEPKYQNSHSLYKC